jgi:tryptophanyl-tRNA synthetase
MGELRRMTQFKDKTAGAEGESIAVGLFDYPVLMAADILLYQADAVPVGEDQKQHVELTRDLAERFNNAFGKTFVVPEPVIPDDAARVMGLDDPTKKMSKSAGSESNYVALMDPPDVIRRKIKRAVTDSGTEVRPGDDKPALTNLLTIYSATSGDPVETIVERYAGRGYADFKSDLGEVVVGCLEPIQARVRELQADKSYTLGVLKEGAERAEAIAERTLSRARDRLGLVPRPR